MSGLTDFLPSSYGYSPFSLAEYAKYAAHLFRDDKQATKKPIVFSITGTPVAVSSAIRSLRQWASRVLGSVSEASELVGVEINLSCPNIKDHDTPTAYDSHAIREYILAVQQASAPEQGLPVLTVGLKLPPYTYEAQFRAVIQCLESIESPDTRTYPIAFLTSTNTLGASLWLNESEPGTPMAKALPTSGSFDGTGGLAGESLHPLSLGRSLST